MNNSTVDQEARIRIADAIEILNSSLDADGFRLKLREYDLDNRSVVVELEATDSACTDCLVPEPVMQQVILNAAGSWVDDLESVQINRVGF